MTLEPRYADDRLTIYAGDCRRVLAELPAESVHMVVTSPPYWALRDYGTASWEGGDPECDHVVGMQPPRSSRPAGLLHGGHATVDAQDAGKRARHECPRCGARRVDAQLGLEATPEEYVQTLVEIFRELRRVLRRDGTAWLNLGDTYVSSGQAGPQRGLHLAADRDAPRARPRNVSSGEAGAIARPPRQRLAGLKEKDLIGIPWRVAFALQADGWYLRRDVVWSKPNPMPESVEDRPTSAHEYVFLLSRSERYFYDHVAVRQPHSREWWRESVGPGYMEPWQGRNDGGKRRGNGDPSGRNLRSVWSIATEPYGGNHFATYPRKLVEPCVLAGSSAAGVCPDCGAPWRRLVESSSGGLRTSRIDRRGARRTHETDLEQGRPPMGGGVVFASWRPPATAGWEASCAHELEPVPATVLDPFGGTGTTALAAEALGRRTVLIELNDDSIDQALKRVAGARFDRGTNDVDMPIAPPDDSLWALADRAEEAAV